MGCNHVFNRVINRLLARSCLGRPTPPRRGRRRGDKAGQGHGQKKGRTPREGCALGCPRVGLRFLVGLFVLRQKKMILINPSMIRMTRMKKRMVVMVAPIMMRLSGFCGWSSMV